MYVCDIFVRHKGAVTGEGKGGCQTPTFYNIMYNDGGTRVFLIEPPPPGPLTCP